MSPPLETTPPPPNRAPPGEPAAGNPLRPAVKPDWPEARRRHERWWRGDDLVLALTAPLDAPRRPGPEPAAPQDAQDKHIGLPGRIDRAEHHVHGTAYLAEAVPVSPAMGVGPGDLAAMLGAQWRFAHETVWYEPCITDPQTHPPLQLDRDSLAFQRLTEMTLADLRRSGGRYLTGIPDLIENIDILAALRGSQNLLMDMFDHPGWIERSVFEINAAFFAAFDHFYELTKDAEGWSVFTAFAPAGPGRTAKVQCDACAMFGPDQFKQFVVPALTEQCQWLDHSMYHLDGQACWPNLDPLLGIDALDAIEWTPKFTGGGHPQWYGLYRRIKSAGKAVQAICVRPDEVIPLLDAVGPAGMYVQCHAASEAEAEALIGRVAPYYPATDPTPAG